MGRIKTTLQKRIGRRLVAQHSEKLTTDFEKNKPIVGTLADFPSKKLRNVVTGYITHLMRKNQK